MNATLLLPIRPRDAVPKEGRAAWLGRHGVLPESAEVHIEAPLERWEAAGATIHEDASLSLEAAAAADLLTALRTVTMRTITTTGVVPSDLALELVDEAFAAARAAKAARAELAKERRGATERMHEHRTRLEPAFRAWLQARGGGGEGAARAGYDIVAAAVDEVAAQLPPAELAYWSNGAQAKTVRLDERPSPWPETLAFVERLQQLAAAAKTPPEVTLEVSRALYVRVGSKRHGAQFTGATLTIRSPATFDRVLVYRTDAGGEP